MASNRFRGIGEASEVPPPFGLVNARGLLPIALRSLPVAGAWVTLPNYGGMAVNGGKKIAVTMNQTNFPAEPAPDFVVLFFYPFDSNLGWSNGINYGPMTPATGPTRIVADVGDEFFQVFVYRAGGVLSGATIDIDAVVS